MPPQLNTPVELPANFEGIITIYPDNLNTAEVRRYWLIPSTARIVRNPGGKLAFGLVHSGISSFDPDGINALLNVTVQPYVDDKTLNQAKTLVEKKALDEGAKTVSFNFVSPTETSARLLVGGQFVDMLGKEQTVVKGGSVEAGIPFQVKVTKSFDVRCLAQAGGEEGATFGALYTMKFQGVGNPVKFTITASFEETYKHFAARVKASGWFGLAKADVKTEWQELKKQPFVKLKIDSGTEEDIEKFHARDLFNKLLDQVTNQTGLFARVLKPSGLPDAPGGGGIFGWGLSVGGGYEAYTDRTDFVVSVDAQYTREQEIAFGMNFPTGGAELKGYVKNITDTTKPWPTSDDFKKQAAQQKQCIQNNVKTLKQWRDDGTISQQLYDELIKDAITKGCHVNLPGGGDADLLFNRDPGAEPIRDEEGDILGNEIDPETVLRFFAR